MPDQPHIGQLLRDAFAEFEERLLEAVHAAGGRDLRPTHNAVLRFLDAGGTRATTLAERSGLTRQAVTLIVDDLERLGVVTREPDPADRRAKRVVYTPRGRALFDASRDAIARIERDYAARVGRDDYAALKRSLARLTGGGERGWYGERG